MSIRAGSTCSLCSAARGKKLVERRFRWRLRKIKKNQKRQKEKKRKGREGKEKGKSRKEQGRKSKKKKNRSYRLAGGGSWEDGAGVGRRGKEIKFAIFLSENSFVLLFSFFFLRLRSFFISFFFFLLSSRSKLSKDEKKNKNCCPKEI